MALQLISNGVGVSVGFEPVCAGAGGYFERDGAVIGVFHQARHKFLHDAELGRNDIEDEFVVNLHYHA